VLRALHVKTKTSRSSILFAGVLFSRMCIIIPVLASPFHKSFILSSASPISSVAHRFSLLSIPVVVISSVSFHMFQSLTSSPSSFVHHASIHPTRTFVTSSSSVYQSSSCIRLLSRVVQLCTLNRKLPKAIEGLAVLRALHVKTKTSRSAHQCL
jgi:hypothetical protein